MKKIRNIVKRIKSIAKTAGSLISSRSILLVTLLLIGVLVLTQTRVNASVPTDCIGLTAQADIETCFNNLPLYINTDDLRGNNKATGTLFVGDSVTASSYWAPLMTTYWKDAVNGQSTDFFLQSTDPTYNFASQLTVHHPGIVSIFLGIADVDPAVVTNYEQNLRIYIALSYRANAIPNLTLFRVGVNAPRDYSKLLAYDQIILRLSNEFHLPVFNYFKAITMYESRTGLTALGDNIHPTQNFQTYLNRVIADEFVN